MKRLLVAIIALGMISGAMVLTGCKDNEGGNSGATNLLLLQQQRVMYEIPKGVAQ